MTALELTWSPLEPPRAPVAVLAWTAEQARELATSVERLVVAGADLRACHGDGLLLVVGDEDALPWAEGVTYLGREADVLLPTTATPDLPVDLIAQAAAQLAPTVDGSERRQLVLLPGRVLVFTLADAPLEAGQLA